MGRSHNESESTNGNGMVPAAFLSSYGATSHRALIAKEIMKET